MSNYTDLDMAISGVCHSDFVLNAFTFALTLLTILTLMGVTLGFCPHYVGDSHMENTYERYFFLIRGPVSTKAIQLFFLTNPDKHCDNLFETNTFICVAASGVHF